MQRITEQMLKTQIAYLNRQTGHKEQAWERDETGRLRANIGTYHLDCAYGGYNLGQMVTEGGGISHPIASGFYTKRELYNMIRAYIAGKTEPTKTMMIEVGTFNKLCADRKILREALQMIHNGNVMHGKADYTLGDVIQEHYKICRNILTRTKEG